MTDYTELKRLAEAATQGEWQVIETELPCRIGRPHVERRIFTAKDHPQLKAPYPVVNGSVALGTDETPVHRMVSMTAEDAAYIAAANPAAVLALIAENERLKTLRSVTERDLAQELEVWRNGPSCWNCGDTGDVHDIVGEWRGKCDCNAAKLIDVSYERDQLCAEVARIRTGYEAYERVNAELKAENEALRKRIDDMSPFKGTPLIGPDLKCLACGGYHYGLSGLPCPKFRNTAQSDLPETRSGQIGAPMVKGERP